MDEIKSFQYLTAKVSGFEQHYLTVRQQEGWIYTDEQVERLPVVDEKDQHAGIWKMRASTARDFVQYVQQSGAKSILEIGCGNGWFSAYVVKNSLVELVGLDINVFELEQASRVFQMDRLSFVYADIFALKDWQKFDLIVLNGSIQYFPDLNQLFLQLDTFLNPGGEVHVLDSPFYETRRAAEAAQERTIDYFERMGVVGMAEHYFHHCIADLPKNANNKKRIFSRILPSWITGSSPFPWLVISHDD